jgi:hypothetical protein
MPTSIVKLALVTAAPIAVNAAAGEVFGDEHLRLIVSLVATVGVVVAAVTWMRDQTEGQIKKHAREDRQRHRAVLQEIRHVRELLAIKLDAPEFAPQQVTGEIPLEDDEI